MYIALSRWYCSNDPKWMRVSMHRLLHSCGLAAGTKPAASTSVCTSLWCLNPYMGACWNSLWCQFVERLQTQHKHNIVFTAIYRDFSQETLHSVLSNFDQFVNCPAWKQKKDSWSHVSANVSDAYGATVTCAVLQSNQQLGAPGNGHEHGSKWAKSFSHLNIS